MTLWVSLVVLLSYSYPLHVHAIGEKYEKYGQNPTKPLFDYIAIDDPLYSWNDIEHSFLGATNHGAYRAHVINMTSGSFLNDSIVDHVIWWHYIVLIIPIDHPLASTEEAFFWTACADPGTNTDPSSLPDATDLDVLIAAEVVTLTHIPTFVIFTNPNQPIVWTDDPQHRHRTSDALLAMSFYESIRMGYPPIFFPMVRANIRALDAVQQWTRQRFEWNLQSFAAGGGSKWGWLTWLFAAVDDRVVAFVPVVFDLLRWKVNVHHQWKSYGGWTWAWKEYWELGLMASLDTDVEEQIMETIDPYNFRHFYREKPKLVAHNGRDEFFMPDDSWVWWEDMPGPKWMLFVPNTEHAGITGLMETIPAIATWTHSVLRMDYERIIPQVTWTLDHESYKISATTNMLPTSAKIWYTQSVRGRRDFRALTLDSPCKSGVELDGKCYNVDSLWLSEDLEYTARTGEEGKEYEWEATLNERNIFRGSYRAFFIDFTFNMSTSQLTWPEDVYNVMELSTECMIQNDSFPFADCSGSSCNGTLL